MITSAGVSAEIDMALVARLTDEPTAGMMQLWIEDDPIRPSAESTGIRRTGTWPSRRSPGGSRPSWPTDRTSWPS